MKSVEEVVYEFHRRQSDRGAFFEACRIMANAYNNELVLPLPEVTSKDAPAVANLIGSGIDQTAMRIASMPPDIQSPPLKPGDSASEKRADRRRRAALGWWEVNDFELLQRRRARHLVTYAQAPVYLRPDKATAANPRGTNQPKWEPRTPLECYPADLESTEMRPADCIFAFTRSVGWLKQAHPEFRDQLNAIRLPPTSQWSVDKAPLTDEDPVEIIQFLGDEEIVVLATGQGECEGLVHEAEYGIQDARIINLGPVGGSARMWAAILQRVPNRLGMCPVVVPGRITLGRLKGQFDDSLGLYQMQAKLMAMEVNAIANGIWPDQWLVGVGGQTPQIITQADGRRGIIGQVQNGTLDTTQVQPGMQTPNIINMLERGMRITSGVPSDFSGESPSNVRTARRGDAILSEAVDFGIQEHQQILARSNQHELEIAVAVDMAYFRNTRKSFYVDWKGARGRLDYTPKDIWSEDRTLRVSFAKAGSDVSSLNVQIGQLMGVGLLSKESAARMHPDIKDPAFEAAQIVVESLQAAQLASLQQAAAAGTLSPVDLARIEQRAGADGVSLAQAVIDQQDEAQQRQAAQVPAQAPEAQPGLAPAATAGAEAQPTIGPVAPSLDNLTQTLRALRTQGQIASTG